MTFDVLAKTIQRAEEVDLTTIVCADSMADAGKIAGLHPDIIAGADATGSSSCVAKAADRAAMVDEMIAAVQKAWDERHV